MAAGFKSQFGTLAKPAHAGLAAKTGVLAAQLAASGIDASPDTLDGEWSLLTRAAGPEAPGFAEPLAQLGKGLAIVDHGLVVKRFPCCSYIHKSLDGLLELRAGHGLTAADVAAVAITIPGRNTEILRFPSPETPSEARFSMEYCAAAALHQGTLTLADFTQAAVERPAVRALLPRIRMTGYPVSARSSDLTAQEPEVVTLELLSGDRLTASTTVVKGAAERPLSPDELSAKFRGCCELLLPTAAAVERAEILLDRLDALETVAEAMAGFAGPSDSVVAAQ